MLLDGSAPPRPDPLRTLAQDPRKHLVESEPQWRRLEVACIMIAGQMPEAYWVTVAAYVDYLDARAAAFRLDQPVDAYLPDAYRAGITEWVARVRSLAARCTESIRAGQWIEAHDAYVQAYRAALTADLWTDTGRVEAEKLAQRAQRAAAAPRGGEAKRRQSEAKKAVFARDSLPTAREYRKRHHDAPVTAIIRYLRLTEDLDESDPTIRKWLHEFGVRTTRKKAARKKAARKK